ncbi:hypothetical protein B4U79_16519 [Dinothrombium tinctorium]|uniref:MYND-type domain-containing protein n=1 Tax=Dinothrombium tinctorium TaxID=1965070 RepID=A0A3S3RMZ7_9ACAR|nr:hypothetical protein B4U79_16519 [Dinothrombium tinctorium]
MHYEYDLCKVYVARIPLEFSEEHLRDHLSKLHSPQPTDVMILRPKTVHTRDGSLHFQYAFLEFETPGDASQCIHCVDKRLPYNLHVSFARKVRKERDVSEEFKRFLKSKRKNGDSGNESFSSNDGDSFRSSNNNRIVKKKIDDILASDDCKTSSVIEQLTNSNALFQMIRTKDDTCYTCLKSDYIEHLHFIVKENRIYDPYEELPELADIFCSSCERPLFSGQVCKRCYSAFYCNKSCQINHWSKHSKRCSLPK